MTRQYPELSGQEKFEHFPIYTDGYRHLHPADMIPLKDGSVLLTAREATEHVARDGDIVVLRSENNVRKWTKASRFGVPDLDEREACGVQLPDGTILLAVFYNALYRQDGEYEQKWKSTVNLGAGKQYLGFLRNYLERPRDNVEQAAFHLDRRDAVFLTRKGPRTLHC